MRDHLEDVLREFADRIRDVARQEILAALQAGGAMPARRGPGRPPKASVSAPIARRRKGQKRDPKELDALVGKLAAAIKSKPGQRIEEIGRALGVATKELALPAKRLLAEKTIKTTGNRRATKYFPR